MTPVRLAGATYFLLLISVCPLGAEAVGVGDLRPRDRVLVTRRGSSQKVEGHVVRVTLDTLYIVPTESSHDSEWPTQDIRELQKWSGRGSSWAEGLLYGAIGAGVTGVVWGLATGETEDTAGNSEFDCESRSCRSLMGGALGAMAGGIAGFMIGAFIESDRWETVEIPRP
ncbi:MAG TPA: hypothetical protein VFE28_08795 [Candidatus Krumholzibacteria bacterium]|nr:hypothetical protein [Candidatus Krumholzibacteria bacterium]